MTDRDMAELRYLLRGVMRREEKEYRRRTFELVMCGGKHAFDTKAGAVRAARRKGIGVFRCAVCSKWHCGSAQGARQARLRDQKMRAR